MAKKKQGYKSRLDESLAMRKGSSKNKKQSLIARADESIGMEKSMMNAPFSSVKTMHNRKKKQTRKRK